MRTTWFIGQVLTTVCFIVPAIYPDNKLLVFVLFALVGASFSAMNSIPFSLITKYSKKGDENNTGLMMGVLNAFIVLSQALSNSLLGTVVLKIYNNQVKYSIIFGGVFTLVAGFMVWILDSEKKIKSNQAEEGKRLFDNEDVSDSF